MTKAEQAIYDKIRYTKPEVKVAKKAANKAYHSTSKGKIVKKTADRLYRVSEEGVATLKASHLKARCNKVGITPEYYNSLPKKCSLPGCNASTPGGIGDWHLDHGHVEGFKNFPFEEKGKHFRGLLCHSHNTGLGKFHDSVDELRSAIDYLKTHSRAAS